MGNNFSQFAEAPVNSLNAAVERINLPEEQPDPNLPEEQPNLPPKSRIDGDDIQVHQSPILVYVFIFSTHTYTHIHTHTYTHAHTLTHIQVLRLLEQDSRCGCARWADHRHPPSEG
jgi:hypothetical protein